MLVAALLWGPDRFGDVYTHSAEITVTFNPALTITTTTMPAASEGSVYPSVQLASSGGIPRLTWANSRGGISLGGGACTGLSISPVGVVSGTPTTSGTCHFTAKVTDTSGGSCPGAACDTQTLSIAVNAAGRETAHTYFNNLVADGAFWKGLSLRPTPGVACTAGGYTSGTVANGKCNPYFANQLGGPGVGYSQTAASPYTGYDFAGDTHPEKQDALKFVIPAFIEKGTLNNSVDAETNVIVIHDTGRSSVWDNQKTIKIDNEWMVINTRAPVLCPEQMAAKELKARAYNRAADTVTLTVCRAQWGTTAASHAAGAISYHGNNNLASQIRYPLAESATDTSDGYTYLFTWDFLLTSDFMGYRDLERWKNYKAFQFTSESLSDQWWELNTRIDLSGVAVRRNSSACDNLNPSVPADYARLTAKFVSALSAHAYNGKLASLPTVPWSQLSDKDKIRWLGTDGAELLTADEPVRPQDGSFCQLPSAWTRWWVVIQARSNDWDIVNLWVADETRGPVRVFNNLYGSLVHTGPRPNQLLSWWIEFNTSTQDHALGTAAQGGDRNRTGYVRNFAALRWTNATVPAINTLVTNYITGKRPVR